MLPANLGIENSAQAKRDLPISLSPIKLGNSAVSNTFTGSTHSTTGQLTVQKCQDELQYLSINSVTAKQRDIKIKTYSNNNKTNINNNATAIKTKVTSATIVQKQNPKSQSVIQLVAAKPNGNNSNPLLSILTPKTLKNSHNNTNDHGYIQPQTTPSPPQILVQPQVQAQSVLIRPATTMTTVPVSQQNGSSPGGTVLATTAQSNVVTLMTNKTTPTTITSCAPQISLLSNPLKSRAPVILSKAAVEKIRFKFGQAQVQANSGALVLSKSFKNNNTKKSTINSHIKNNNSRLLLSSNCIKPAKATPGQSTALRKSSAVAPILQPTSTSTSTSASTAPIPITMPINTNVDLPEIKFNQMPAVNLNGTKIMKMQTGTLAVVKPKSTIHCSKLSQYPPSNLHQTFTQSSNFQSSSKLQRSKSLAGNEDNSAIICSQHNSAERRHSVAIMAKEVDVVEEIKTIETITIDDDDSEEEQEIRQPTQVKIPQTPTTLMHRKSSSNSRISRSSISSSGSSEVELVCLSSNMPKELLKSAQQPPQQRNSAIICITKAETLPLSKADFEKSLRCDERVHSTSASSGSICSISKSNNQTLGPNVGTITLTPLARLQNNVEALRDSSLSVFERNMQLNFGMLRWRESQPTTLENSKMNFELNRFNFLQVMERCERRKGPANYFEQSLYDRKVRRPLNSSHPLLYLCSRCNCHGPASDFLGPQFCSISCVRRAQKRRQPHNSHSSTSEKSRRIDSKFSTGQHHQRERELERVHEHERKAPTTKRPFRWSEYLKIKGNGNAAPIHLFLNPFPISPNCFENGMKLEAIDPENCSLFCVCTIVEIRGYRLKLKFDGYSSMYEFWVNADSMDIFPPGWCESTSRVLQVPKEYTPDNFKWYRYLMKTNSKAAPRSLFTHLNEPTQQSINGFNVGMHLEAEDLNDTGKICVATVADKLDERIRVHFDGWDDCYDFWVHVNSPYIHPCGWHEGRQQLIVPPEFQNVAFNWSNYIRMVGGIAAPARLFAPRQPMEFQSRMKLEVVDQRNPCLIRPATVITRKGYRVQLHLDCWPSEYYFWLEDDSPDLHPIGWCEATLHELESPPGFLQRPSSMPCDVEGCRGFGNAKRFNLNMHGFRDCCPYATENWRQWRAKTVKPPRVLPQHIQKEPVKEMLTSRFGSTKPRNKTIKPQPGLETTLLKPKVDREGQNQMPGVTQISDKCDSIEVNPQCLTIAKSIVSDYGPQFARNYRQWQKNSDFDMAQLKSNPLYWTNWDVYEFVERALGSSSIAQMLFDEEIDGRALLMMGRKDLATYFNLKVGPTVKLFSMIVNLRIAVACKFDTKQTGLNIKRQAPPKSEHSNSAQETKHLLGNKPTFILNNRLDVSPPTSINRDADELEEEQEQDDDEMLDEEQEEEVEAEDDDDTYEDQGDHKKYIDHDFTDDEDVMLDNEDFLNVPPSHSIVNNYSTINYSDVTMNALDDLPTRAASAS